MTDIAKAIAFATSCLKWTSVSTEQTPQGTLVRDGGSNRTFNPDDLTDLQHILEEFLGDRFFIQVGRNRTSLFHWEVIVGQQNISAPGASYEHSRGVGENLADAILDACVAAALMDRRGTAREKAF
jgi:hypothetical protein